ncbi:Integrator complex subunit 6-A [Cryptotermes secundus]|uniref:Integrator complex subunit 6-A n=3 Tax=Cryptotermes secundus TaxID=105785 RepID=A0A2J7QX31_9NEOP|nr:integrator complex subunit 6-A isoform X1 [Cryptotermes secundus]PNF33141.1 Integrator complex subunit 6-A [Cryptotermes secundus]
MTIIVFLIDTSASMNQRAYLGGRPTLLDVAKGAVETFVKVRQRSPESRGDRYMLLTFEDPPANIKAGWKENLATFMNELKNLQCVGMTTMGAALKHAFDVLNINRMQTGIDTYGQGRCPYFLEPSVIVVITDGGKLSNSAGVQEDFNLPMHSPIPGSELTREPFRWDQRLFSLVLRLSGTPALDRDVGLVPSDTSPIDAMCEVTGGRSYCITSHRMLMQCIDSLVQKVQSGVVINFEKMGPDPLPVISEGTKADSDVTIAENDSESKGNNDKEWDKDYSLTSEEDSNNKNNGVRLSNGVPGNNAVNPLSASSSTAWHTCRRLIYVPRSAQKGFAVGFWPIPESFWPDLSSSSLPPRSAHPNVKFTCTSQEPMVIENLPFDKYELEPSPLTQFILARKQPTVCWQVFVANSYKNSEVGHPFGYLKASTNLTCVNLFVMPYNYPVLLPLLEELFKVHRLKPTNEWRIQFQNYLRTMPTYYAGALRRALTRMGVQGSLSQSLIPDSLDNSLSYSVMNYLKRLKNQAKIEFDRLCNEVGSKPPTVTSGSSGKSGGGSSSAVTEGVRVLPRSPLKKDLVSHPLLQDKFTSLREQLNEFGGFVVGLPRGHSQKGRQSYRNPFDIPRHCLLDQAVRMRANFLQPALAHTKLIDDDFAHSMPVSQMGNYQEYLKRMQPQLREIESAPVRQHMFGNPFKIDKRMMVDEADMDPVGGGSGTHGTTNSHRSGTKRGASQMDPSSPRLPNKRKPGPIPRHVVVRRPTSPSPRPSPLASPNSSPCSSPVWFSPDPPPPLLTPVTLTVMSMESGKGESLVTGPDSEGSEPPKLTMVNGDLDDGIVLHGGPITDFRPRSPSPPPRTSAPPNLEPLANHVIHYNNFSPPLSPAMGNHTEGEDRRLAMVLTEISGNHVVGGNQANVAAVGAISTNSELNKREIAEIRKHNLHVRMLVYREVRRPGKNFAPLFAHLQNIKGCLDVRVTLLKEIIHESLRFKRRYLAGLLEDFLRSMISSTSDSYSVVNNHRPPSNNGATRLT